MQTDQELPVIRAWYEFTIWLIPKIQKFPRDLRYVDDFVLLHNDKGQLAQWRSQIEQYLLRMRLWLHPRKRVISRTIDGIRLLGFRVWPDRIWATRGSTHRARKRMQRYRAMVYAGTMTHMEFHQRIQAWRGHAQILSSHRFAENILCDILKAG